MDVAACNWCLHYEPAVDEQLSFTDLSFRLAAEFNNAQIITSSIHRTIRVFSPRPISLEQLVEKLSGCCDVIITQRFVDEICAVVKII